MCILRNLALAMGGVAPSLMSFACFGQEDERIEQIVYYDNTDVWVIGQVERLLVNGVESLSTTYGSDARPREVREFSRIVAAYEYHPDGTIAAISDANSNRTAYSGWKRGIATSIQHPDGTRRAAAVDDNGWIQSTVDENGFATSYGYDVMGRQTSTAYPGGDPVTWNTASRRFERVDGVEYGIAAGHWRQTSTLGQAVSIEYYDALGRKVLTREYDAGLPNTLRATRYEYDYDGHIAFKSYPAPSEAATAGIWTEYDAIGRLVSTSQDSEHGVLTTLTEYLPGSKARTTDPMGRQTITSYQMFDQPTYEAPVEVIQPMGVRTQIVRDVFGKVTNIIRESQ